jgi:prepilin-type N-terminal cleavage/methylation domain-containing protein
MNKQRAFGFIEILVVLVIIGILYYVMINTYFKKGVVKDKKTAEVLQQEGISTSNYQSMIDSVKKKVGDVNKKSQQQNDTLDRME